jgi:hypothetical protein
MIMRAWLPLFFLVLAVGFVPAAQQTAASSIAAQVEDPPATTVNVATSPRHCPNPALRHPINIGPNSRFGSGARAKAKAASTAMGLVGGLLGGGGSSGSSDRREEGPRLAKCKIKDSEMTVFTDPETGIELKVGAKRDSDGLVVFAEVDESPDNGTFQTAFLENANGEVLAPSDVQMCELWGEWKLTVSWTKTTYVDNQIVKQESGGWQKTGLFSLPGELDESAASNGFWNRLGFSNASHGARMIAMRYPVGPLTTEEGPFATVIHVTRPGRDPVDTWPFGLNIEEGLDGIGFTRERKRDCPPGGLLLADGPNTNAPPPASNPAPQPPRPPETTGETPPPGPEPEGDDPRDEDEECPWPTDKLDISMVDEGDHYTITYGTTPTYTSLGDIVKYLTNQVAPHYDPAGECGKCVETLELWGHGDTAGGYISFGDNEGIAGTTKFGANVNENLAALRGLMCTDGNIVVNQCKAGTGQKGTNALQTFADAVGVPVSGPDGKVKSCRIFGGLLTDYIDVAPSAGVATPGQNPPRDVESR